MENKMIKKEKVTEILLWAEEQGHIGGDIHLVIQNIMSYTEEE